MVLKEGSEDKSYGNRRKISVDSFLKLERAVRVTD